MARRPVPIKVKSKDLAQIGQLLRGGVQQVRLVLRALALRLLAEGLTALRVAQTVPLTPKADRRQLDLQNPWLSAIMSRDIICPEGPGRDRGVG